MNSDSQFTILTMRAEKQNTATRRRQIALAAMGIIARQGLKELNLSAVAREVGLVPSALYRHFKGKEEILQATLTLIRELILENLRIVTRESPSPLEQLRLLMRRHLTMIQEFQAIPRIVFSDEISVPEAGGKKAVYKIIRGLLGQVSLLVARGQQMGQVKPDLDPDTVSVIYLGFIQPPAILWYLSQGNFNIDRHMKKAWPVFEEAVKL
ncbi:MAG: TetR/AcrR family transcriptional regulator [Thermodesulfobacteriota bacterium]